MHNEDAVFHLIRLSDRIEEQSCKEALWLLVTELYQVKGVELRPASQGAFSVLQIRVNGRNCFAFKGAKSRIRFYFRKPAFEDGLVDVEAVEQTFSQAQSVQDGEIAVNLETYDDAKLLLEFVIPKLGAAQLEGK